jgi:hypothetical protein
MAKSAKQAPPKAPAANAPKLTTGSLVAAAASHSQPVCISFTFTAGIAQVTTALFRKGILINMQSISSSGDINFSEVQSGDVISVNGVCTGQAEIAINTATTPVTPEQFNTGLIIAGYLIN